MRRRERSDSVGGVRQALAAKWRDRLERAEAMSSGHAEPGSAAYGRRQYYLRLIEAIEGTGPVELHAWQIPAEWRPSWASGCDRVLISGSTVVAIDPSDSREGANREGPSLTQR